MSAHTSTMAVAGADRWLVREELHAQPGTMLGFWLYLMSDCLIFACLFAMYGVVGGNYAAGPSPKDLFAPGSGYLCGRGFGGRSA